MLMHFEPPSAFVMNVLINFLQIRVNCALPFPEQIKNFVWNQTMIIFQCLK